MDHVMDRVRNLTLQRANSDYSKQGFGHYDLLQVCVLHASCMTVPLHEEANHSTRPTCVFDCGNQSADVISEGGVLQYNRINRSYVYTQGFSSM